MIMNSCFIHGAIIVFVLVISVDPKNRNALRPLIVNMGIFRNNYAGYRQVMTSSKPDGLCSAHYTDPAAQTIQSLYSSIAAADCALANPINYPPHYSPIDGEEFDFIIVGAGSAGCVVANRLTEVTNWKVLLLEAGGNPTKTSEVPALFAELRKTRIDWQYQTDPKENNCLGMEGNSCNYPRGKVLGGTSTINYMAYVRGNAKDYNRWAAEGNKGWSYNDVLPYFKKHEDMRAKEVLRNPDFKRYHNTGGYLTVETWQNDDVKPLANSIAEGMRELGYLTNSDINGRNQTGFARVQGTLRKGQRCSTAKAFLIPINRRENLKVSKYSLVSKILIDDKQKTAYGVEFINKKGKLIRVYAKKEVILSGGSINTPQLLLLSGIGPRKHLESLKIEVIKDLPVGKHLQDHPLMNSVMVSLDFSKTVELPEKNMFYFLLNKNSSYSSLGLVTYPFFINTIKAIDYPDIQIIPVDFNKNDQNGLLVFLGINGYRDDIIRKYLEINSKSYVILMSSSLLRPFSRGSIQLKSRNPTEYPKITTGFLYDQRDIDTYLRLYDFLYQLVNTKGLNNVNAKLHEIEVPECSTFKLGSRKYRECSLRYLTTATYHPTSTCRMGPPGSTDSVVDPDLRVKGINGLRVIDASIMPRVVSGNINAAVIMIGEKGSDLVKAKWISKNIGVIQI